MQQHYDMIKGFGVSAVGFVAWAINHAEVDKLLGTASAFFALVLLIFTIVEKIHQWRIRNRKMRRFEAIRSSRADRRVILPLLLVGMTLATAGCAAPRKPVAVSRVASPIERADVVAVQSRARVQKVQARITTAREAVALLKTTATPGQWPAIDKIEVSLTESTRLLDEELEQNKILTVSLNTARDALTDVLLEQERIMKELAEAEEKARAYTRLKLWIATLVAAIAAWLTWQFLPGFLGSYKWWAVGVTGAAAFGATLLVL